MGRLKKYSTLTKRLEALEAAEQGRRVAVVWPVEGMVTLPTGEEMPEEEFDRRCERDGVKVLKLVWTELDGVDYEGL